MQERIASQMRSSRASRSSRLIVALFVGALHLRDRQSGSRGHLKHLLGAREGIGNLDGSDLLLLRAHLLELESVTTKPPPIE
jgi:hypothetical protein